MSIYDPSTRSDADCQKEVDSGKIDAFRRSETGGIYKYLTGKDGETIIKDLEPANTRQLHRQTDFTIRDGRITDIRPHKYD